MDITGKTVLITGANRGIGAALVSAFLKHGIGTVYAAARNPSVLPDFNDARVVPIKIDITNATEISAAAEKVGKLDILLNNAGIMTFGNVMGSSSEDLTADLNTNYYGTVRMMQSFAPLIERNGGGAIANVVSILGLVPLSAVSGYSASKAALHSATQSARVALKGRKIEVIGIYPGPIDTDLSAQIPMAKTSPAEAAEEIVKGIIAGTEDVFPDGVSQEASSLWASNPKGLEQHFASLAG